MFIYYKIFTNTFRKSPQLWCSNILQFDSQIDAQQLINAAVEIYIM